MSAGKLDITVEQGASFSLPITFTNSDGTPLDVSAWVFTGQIRATYSSATSIQALAFVDGVSTNVVIAGITAANTALIPVNPTTSFEITPTLYCYDIDALLPDTTVMRVLQGAALISPRVTR